jgi:hypothetical protein
MAAFPAALVLATSVVQPAHAITFDDGMVHVIDAANSFPFEATFVDDGPGPTTTTVTVEPPRVSRRL